MVFVVLCRGTPKGSTGSCSGFKASQKTGQRLEVSSDRLGEAWNRTCDPWFTRHRFIPYTTAASLCAYISQADGLLLLSFLFLEDYISQTLYLNMGIRLEATLIEFSSVYFIMRGSRKFCQRGSKFDGGFFR